MTTPTTRRGLLALLCSASALAAMTVAAGAQPNICRPWAHHWVPVGTAPGTGRPILRCTKCGLTKIQ
jgi:hypothetical protein